MNAIQVAAMSGAQSALPSCLRDAVTAPLCPIVPASCEWGGE